MINEKTGQRELAYVVNIDAIEPIVGSDNCEAAVVGGWRVMVRKGTFEPNDLAIYFEIDSKVDTTRPEFAFLEKRDGKIKTQRYTFGGKGLMFSQGLLMAPEDFGWKQVYNEDGHGAFILDENTGHTMMVDDDSRFLTKELDVTYAVAEDNIRKSNGDPNQKYKAMGSRHAKLAKTCWWCWLMKREWGRKLLFTFFGKKKDKKNGWPSWVVKTDEERIECIPHRLTNKDPWIATEKIDGTSTTFTMKRGKWGKNDFYICSRNVVFDKPDKQCFYETNVYTEMAQKYDIENVLASILADNPDLEWVTLQGETYGAGIQKRDYGLTEHRFMGFNFITSKEGRWNSVRAAKFMENYNIPWVPILDENYILPDTIEELRAFSHSEGSRIDGEIKEGIVFRSQDGSISFKCVDPDFLMKYHG